MNNDSMKNLIIAILSGVCVVLWVILIWMNISKSDTWPNSSNESDIQEVASGSTQFDFSSIAQKFLNDPGFNICAVNSLDVCMQDYATQNNESLSCDELLWEQNRNNCKQNEILNDALSSWDVETCSNIWDDLIAQGCMVQVNVEKWIAQNYDTTVCDELSDEFKNQCINIIVRQKAFNTKDADACDELILSEERESERDFCREEVEFEIQNEAFLTDTENANSPVLVPNEPDSTVPDGNQ